MRLRFPSQPVPSGFAIGTLLTCFAIVLGAGDFRKTANREEARMSPAPIVTSSSMGRLQWDEESRPDRSQFVTEIIAVVQQMGLGVEPSSNTDQGGALAPAPQRDATVVGIWAPDASACSLQNFREGLLPTIINADGAWAGDTYCTFKNQKQTETGWRVNATCSNRHEQWTTQVRLIVKGDRLIWTSKRGSQTYTRCAPDSRMAQAH